MIQKIKTILIIGFGLAFIMGLFMPSGVRADTGIGAEAGGETGVCPDINGQKYAHPLDSNGDQLPGCVKIKTAADCPSGVPGVTVNGKTDTTKCQPLGNKCPEFAGKTGICTTNPILSDLNLIVNVLAALVGVAVVGSIILGGIQFSAAGAKAEAIAAAKQRIINGLIALAAFLFIYAFLQWLIPGGIFK